MTTSSYCRQSMPGRSHGIVSTLMPCRASGSTARSSSMTNPAGSCRVRNATRRTSTLGIDDELRAAKERERLAGFLVRDYRVPELRRAPEVLRPRDHGDDSLAGRAEAVGLALDARESARALGQVGNAAVAAGGVGERDDGARVQVAVGRDVVRLDRELGVQFPVRELREHDAHVAGQ